VDTERPFTDAVRDVERLSRERTQTAEPDDPRIRRTWWFFAASLAVAGLAMALRLATGDAGPLDWLLTGLLVVAGVAAIVHRRAVAALELRRRIEAELGHRPAAVRPRRSGRSSITVGSSPDPDRRGADDP
jgi:hypothetical protein